MHAVTGLSLLALAGSVLAAPYPGRPVVVYETDVVTVVKTVTGAAPAPTQAAVSVAQKGNGYHGHGQRPKQSPKPQSSVVYTTADQPKPTSSAAPPKPSSTTQKPVAQPTPEPEEPSSSSAYAAPPAPTGDSSGGADYMSIVNEWRSKLSMPELKHDDKLQSNIGTTCTEGNGVMKHKLLPGTMGQVLAPGKCGDMASFKSVFVGGWLCEIPSLPGLDGVCATMSKGWAYEGQTGHAEILTSDSYSKIGCACVEDIWGCDLA